MTDELRDCPKCGAKDALETALRIDLDDVVVRDGEVVSFIPAGSANDPTNGLVVEEAMVSCRDCGYEVEGCVPYSVIGRWRYYEPNPNVERAQQLAHMLNRGWAPHVALNSLGIDPDSVSVEEGLAIDDPDNDVIDLLYDEHGVCAYVQRHAGRWHVHTVTKEN